MNADHALLSGEVKRSVPIEMQRQQPSLSLYFLPVICILIGTFSYSGGRGGGGGVEPEDTEQISHWFTELL